MENCMHQFGNLEETSQIPTRHKLPKLTQKEIENLSGSITRK